MCAKCTLNNASNQKSFSLSLSLFSYISGVQCSSDLKMSLRVLLKDLVLFTHNAIMFSQSQV